MYFNFYRKEKTMKDFQAIVQPIEIKARVYLNKMNEAKIENEADKENAVIMLKEISDYKKAIKKQEDELSSDAKKELAEIKAMFNEPKSFLNDAEEIVRGKINHFLNEQRARKSLMQPQSKWKSTNLPQIQLFARFGLSA